MYSRPTWLSHFCIELSVLWQPLYTCPIVIPTQSCSRSRVRNETIIPRYMRFDIPKSKRFDTLNTCFLLFLNQCLWLEKYETDLNEYV